MQFIRLWAKHSYSLLAKIQYAIMDFIVTGCDSYILNSFHIHVDGLENALQYKSFMEILHCKNMIVILTQNVFNSVACVVILTI